MWTCLPRTMPYCPCDSLYCWDPCEYTNCFSYFYAISLWRSLAYATWKFIVLGSTFNYFDQNQYVSLFDDLRWFEYTLFQMIWIRVPMHIVSDDLNTHCFRWFEYTLFQMIWIHIYSIETCELHIVSDDLNTGANITKLKEHTDRMSCFSYKRFR
jgi:hypothetical protein